MQHRCPTDARRSIPLAIGAGDSEVGPRFGGAAPEGVAPASTDLVYLATVPWSLEGELEASIFVRRDDDFIFGGNRGKLHSTHADIRIHGKSQRGRDERWSSGLSAHPILIGSE